MQGENVKMFEFSETLEDEGDYNAILDEDLSNLPMSSPFAVPFLLLINIMLRAIKTHLPWYMKIVKMVYHGSSL